jgi:hypothetical protein
MDDSRDNGVELLLICLANKRARIATVNRQIRLAVAAHEYLPWCRPDSDRGQVILDMTRWRVLSEVDTPESAELDDGDTLIFAAPEDIPLGDADDKTIPTAATFEEARSRVRMFDHLTHIPQLFRCRVTDEQFEQLVSEAITVRGRREPAQAERKLLADMIRTCDQGYRERRERSLLEFVDSIRNIISANRETYRSGLPIFLNKFRRTPSEQRSGSSYHLLCNAAALHIEPTLQSPHSLLQLAQNDELEVGVIRIDTVQSARLPEVHINTIEVDVEDDVSPGTDEEDRSPQAEN